MSKISMLVTVTFVVAILTTNALAGKKRGAAIGALAGAAAGYLTEQKVKEIESRDFFEDDYIKLTADYLILKSTGDSESVALTLMDKNKVIQKAIRQLNASVARQTPKWENLSGIFELEEYDVIGHIDFVSGKRAFIFLERDGDTTYVVNLVSIPPGAWAYIKSFVLNNIILVAIILFTILGTLLFWIKNKITNPKRENENLNYAEAYNNRGNAYYSKGDHERAISDYNEAIMLNPNFAEAYNNRGYVYEKKGDIDKAIADYESALRIDPNSSTAQEGLERAKKRWL
jgi:tetratricopeptide (TPR) repeat protein